MKKTSRLLSFPTLCASFAALLAGATPARATFALLTDDTTVYTGSAVTQGAAVSLSVSSTTTKCALLHFEIATMLPAGTVPNQIATATLRLFAQAYTAPPAGSTGGVTLHRVTAAWTESTALGLWSSYDPTPAITIGSEHFGLNDFVAIDVTALVRGWVQDPATNLGLILRPTGTLTVLFNSKESIDESHEPTLEITFAPRTRELGDISMGAFKTGTPP